MLTRQIRQIPPLVLGPLPGVGSGSVESGPFAGRISSFGLLPVVFRRWTSSCRRWVRGGHKDLVPRLCFLTPLVHRRASVLSVDVTISWLLQRQRQSSTNTSFEGQEFGILFHFLHKITRASLGGDWLGLSISSYEQEKGNNARTARNVS